VFSLDNKELFIDNTKISYRVEGGGNRVLLLLHGLHGHSGTWRYVIPFFSKKLKVIAPSLPYIRNKTLEELSKNYVILLETILEKEGYDKICIIGNSFGGYVAIEYYCINRKDVECLILEDCYVPTFQQNDVFMSCIKSIEVPVLIIWGEKDEIIPIETAKYLSSNIKSNELFVMENVGHVPHWENPELFNEVVEKFLFNKRFLQ